MKQMFPLDFSILIKEALNEQVYIKLLGSGGGGYLLAFAPEEEPMEDWAEGNNIQLIKIA